MKFDNFSKLLPLNNRYVFEMHNIDVSLANAIRRIILSDVPAVAIDGEIDPTIEVHRNDGPLHNEFMLHRFGLIPICFSEEETENFVSEDYVFTLNVENKTALSINVTSHDFQVMHLGKPMAEKELKRLFPSDAISKEHILITRLRPGEGIQVEGHAIKSTARYHAGFSHVSLCTMSFIPKQTSISSGEEVHNKNVLDKERSYTKNAYGDPTVIQFEIESETAWTPKSLVSKAIEILMQKLHKTVEEVYNAESMYVTFDASLNMFTFIDEDDTLGNYLQSTMHNHYVRDKKPAIKNLEVTYVGYACPHPLENKMQLRFNLKSSTSDMDYVSTLKEHCERCIAYLQNMQSEWLSVAI
jgi:DNA-directed RNA polymerase alpha subunit